jgi:large subunit ribosomal protein L21
MYAVIETGGKQYRVAPGEQVHVEKLDAQKGDTVVLDRVILLSDDSGNAQIGTPVVEGAAVHARVVTQGRAKKITVFKYKKRKRYRVKTGHKQPFTLLAIDSISS